MLHAEFLDSTTLYSGPSTANSNLKVHHINERTLMKLSFTNVASNPSLPATYNLVIANCTLNAAYLTQLKVTNSTTEQEKGEFSSEHQSIAIVFESYLPTFFLPIQFINFDVEKRNKLTGTTHRTLAKYYVTVCTSGSVQNPLCPLFSHWLRRSTRDSRRTRRKCIVKVLILFAHFLPVPGSPAPTIPVT